MLSRLPGPVWAIPQHACSLLSATTYAGQCKTHDKAGCFPSNLASLQFIAWQQHLGAAMQTRPLSWALLLQQLQKLFTFKFLMSVSETITTLQ